MLGRVGRFFVELGWPIGISVAALLLWELAVRELDIRSIILPPPSEVFVAMFQRSELLLTNLWPSLYLTVVGFALSVVGGILVAVLITYSSIIRKGFYPIIVVSQVVPKIAIAPLFVVWFGTRAMSSLLLVVLVTFFPMTINSALCFQSIDEDIHRMRRALPGPNCTLSLNIRTPLYVP